jgi:hypothetical protein
MESTCTCKHLESFHDDPPGRVCVADPCRCMKFTPCPHREAVTQRRLDGELDIVCVTCGRIVSTTVVA